MNMNRYNQLLVKDFEQVRPVLREGVKDSEQVGADKESLVISNVIFLSDLKKKCISVIDS